MQELVAVDPAGAWVAGLFVKYVLVVGKDIFGHLHVYLSALKRTLR